MAPAYKFIYFVSRGIGETTRFLFKYGGLDFDDVRLQKEEWPQWKNKFAFGTVPVLERDGKQVGQSIAIARYVARQVKLAGNNDWEDLEIDAVVETINDLIQKNLAVFYEKDATRRKSLSETLIKETLPYYLARFEAKVQKNNGYIALDRLTWADFYFATMSPFFDYVLKEDVLADYPKLRGVRDTVNNLPAIKKWIEIRPDIDYLLID